MRDCKKGADGQDGGSDRDWGKEQWAYRTNSARSLGANLRIEIGKENTGATGDRQQYRKGREAN